MLNTFPCSPLQLPDALTPQWVKQPGDLDLWPFNLESGVRVTCDVVYLCANFSIPRPLCSRLRPDVCDRQTSDSIMASWFHKFWKQSVKVELWQDGVKLQALLPTGTSPYFLWQTVVQVCHESLCSTYSCAIDMLFNDTRCHHIKHMNIRQLLYIWCKC